MKKYLLLLLLIVIVDNLRSQDFGPGQQAQGYLDNKNVTVDHATGIFHYKVPLYTLGTGDFQLPIFLEYAAKGVSLEVSSGLIAFNWTLSTGGVVTRTIRGGIADESGDGYLRGSGNVTSLEKIITSVNKRAQDGESDIFTAVFNGQVVNFIIKADQNNRIYAVPLERTNVRIECEPGSGQYIDGWIVTDEDGNRYIYRQKEWSVNIIKEDAISFNGIRDKSYISSWYLNRVEPCTGEPIVFSYLEDVNPQGDQNGININGYYSSYQTRYNYGRPMQERPFDFSKYKNRFDEAIGQARWYLGAFSLEMQLNNQLNLYIGNGEWIRNPNFEVGVENLNANFRIMGQIADFKNIINASSALVGILGDLQRTYSRSSSSPNAQMAATWFGIAKSEVINSINETYRASTKETSGGTSYDVRTPVLDKIVCGGRMVEFYYQETFKSRYILSIRLNDVLGQRISEVSMGQWNKLDELTFLDKDGVEVNRIKFDYYPGPLENDLQWDIWGFPKNMPGSMGDFYSSVVDQENIKAFSLKNIITSSHGTISIDYESNRTGNNYLYGGIRVKSLILDDRQSNTRDTISYRYPGGGMVVYNHYSNQESIQYTEFEDNLVHSRVKFWGTAFLKTGNNGIYYPYVQEVVHGKGMNTYLFHIPQIYPTSSSLEAYAYWLVGLPLAKAVYDNNGNLKQIVKSKYSTGLSFASPSGSDPFYCNDDYFTIIEDTVLNYKQKLLQVKAYEYYMNETYLEMYYMNQKSVLLYSDGPDRCYLDPYYEVYVPNIKPRVNVQLPQQTYYIHHGGKTLLKEQLEYKFEGQITSSASVSDFSTKATGIPYQKVEFFYDNLVNSVNPTRVVTADSKGDIYTTVTKRVTEISGTATPVIAGMKRKNMLAPVIKQLNLKNNMVLSESVSVFDTLKADSTCYITLSEQYKYYPVGDQVYSSSVVDASLFTWGKDKYRQEQEIEYRQKYHSCRPVEETNSSGKSAVCYDYNYGQVILKAEGAGSQSVAASDLNKYNEVVALRNKIDLMRRFHLAFRGFFDLFQKINPEEQSEEYWNYTCTEGYSFMTDLIKAVLFFDKTVPFGYYKKLVDGIRANNGNYLREFEIAYYDFFKSTPDFLNFQEYVYYIKRAINEALILDTDFLKYMYIVDKMYLLECNDQVCITQLPESKRMRLYVLATGDVPVYYEVTHSAGTTSGNVQFSGSSGYSVQTFDLDLNMYMGVTSIILSKPYSGVAYLALVPDNVAFEAVSYNFDGSVFCKFNQNCQVELNEYDAAGRLIRVLDQYGNVLRENQYNVVQNN